MNITNRLFTYPVLSVEKDDYKKSIFKVRLERTMSGVDSLKLSFDIAMDCPELEALIASGQAEYVIHVECSTTAYREALHSFTKHIEHVIPIKRINGIMDMVAFITLKRNIKSFTCSDWVDDYDGISFNLSVGSILAYENLPSLDITKNYEEFKNSKSIFTVWRRVTDEDKPANIDIESPKIKIGLGSKDYDAYSIFSNKPDLQQILNSLIVLPALVFVFEELKQDAGYETYRNREWFIALEKSYEKRGLKFMDEVLNEDKTSYQLAQEAMELPISNAFTQLQTLFASVEED